MTKSELYGVVRTLLAAVGGFAAAKGWIDSETAVSLAGALATVAVAVWSVTAKRVLHHEGLTSWILGVQSAN
jgi:hypothetical protein